MTIIEALTVEHGMFRSLFEQIERELPELSLAETKRLGGIIEALVHKHGEQEMDMALSALNHALAEKGHLESLHLEHAELDNALERVRGATNEREGRGLLQAGLRACREHFEEEEHTVFPALKKALPAKVLTELGEAILRRKAKG